MKTSLINQAAREGDVEKLHNLIRNDPFILRAVALAGGDTPLHIACIGGHVDFVKEVLNLRPFFAAELNEDGFTPLHIASASGDVEIVKELLKVVGCNLCLVKGEGKRISLHYAVARGRIEIIRELLSVCSDSITEMTARGESCFHLAVKNSQFEAFKVLVEHVVMCEKEDVLNSKDEQGNTILHVAASRKQYEVFDLLIDKNFGHNGILDVNSTNKKGLTPLDVLASEGGDSAIQEMLISLFGTGDEENALPTSGNPSLNQSRHEQRRQQSKSASKILQDYFKYDSIKDSPSKVRNTLLVISVLIVTTTYQAVLSPPGGVWQDDHWPNKQNINTSDDSSAPKQSPGHRAGQSVMSTHSPIAYGLFLIFNSLGFFMSLHMMNFLTFELPLQLELRVALFALTITYDTCMVEFTSNGLILVAFIALSTVMPIAIPGITRAVRDWSKGPWCISQSARDSA